MDFSELSLPFSVNDLLSSGSGLLGLVGGFVLLALAFKFVPELIILIKIALNTEYEAHGIGARYRIHFGRKKAVREARK